MPKGKAPARFRPRQVVGKYRIERRLGRGGFADVYRAMDTIEGVRVALKVPRIAESDVDGIENCKKEVRLTSRLDHPNILSIKNADFVGGHFMIVYPLGTRTLADRLRSRISLRTALDYGEQMLDAIAHAHEKRVIHCDIKPENLVLFHDDQLICLTDFGIARMSLRTMMPGSGSGTVGYLAPEQAMGQLSYRSDVFSAALVLYRVLTGYLPEWPFEWPLPGHPILRRKLHPDMIAFFKKALSVNAKRRYNDGRQMRDAFVRLKPRVLNFATRRRRKNGTATVDWRAIRWKAFQTRFGRVLGTRCTCDACGGPVSEPMKVCPWCGTERTRHQEETRFPATCPRCHRGLKLDWTYCPWCYGPAVGPLSDREYSDRHYEGRCSNPRCGRKSLMPFMRYCPWCNRKVAKKWPIKGHGERCRRCGSGVVREFWEHCAWCGLGLRKR